jgi:hypothetical protein
MAMMAITTSSSISVKAARRLTAELLEDQRNRRCFIAPEPPVPGKFHAFFCMRSIKLTSRHAR